MLLQNKDLKQALNILFLTLQCSKLNHISKTHPVSYGKLKDFSLNINLSHKGIGYMYFKCLLCINWKKSSRLKKSLLLWQVQCPPQPQGLMAPGTVLISVPKSCFVLKRTRVTPCSIFCANPWQKNIWISSQPDTGTAALFAEVSGPCGGPEVPTGHPSAGFFSESLVYPFWLYPVSLTPFSHASPTLLCLWFQISCLQHEFP